MNGTPYYYLGIGMIMLIYFVLAYTKKLPSVESIQSLATVVNTKGGNILALAAFTLVFFFTGLGLIYWALNRIAEGKLTADNAVLMMGLSWILGSAFGGSFSAMLKVMSGENPPPPSGTTSTATTTATTSTETPKEK
jgi:hypothetical protein